MKTIPLALCGLFALFGSAFAQINVSLTPAGDGRVEDYFSNAYAEVGLSPQGMYDIDTDFFYGAVEPFSAGSWNIGTLVLDGIPTLTGLETFDITGITGFDFNSFVDGAAFSVLGGYTTSFSGITGSVVLDNGSITSLTLNSTINFAFFAAPSFPYVGTFSMTSTTFDLLVDDASVDFGLGPVRTVWDISGASATVAVPEPSSATLVAIGLGAFAWWKKRRNAIRA